MDAQQFNARYPVGTPCRYFPIAGDPDYLTTRTRSPAWALGHGAAVVSIEGRTGGVLIDHLVIDDPEISPCIGEAMRDTTLCIQRRAAHHED